MAPYFYTLQIIHGRHEQRNELGNDNAAKVLAYEKSNKGLSSRGYFSPCRISPNDWHWVTPLNKYSRFKCIYIPSLTRRLDLRDILQQLLSLVDDIKGEVVHGKRFVRMMLQPLLSQCQILRVKVAHLL